MEETMGGVTKNADRVIEKATALSLTYFLKTNNELLDPEVSIQVAVMLILFCYA